MFVTHDQEEALSLATRIAVMDGGRVVQEGTPREIYYQPADPFVADFIGESNLLAGHGGPSRGRPGRCCWRTASGCPCRRRPRDGPAHADGPARSRSRSARSHRPLPGEPPAVLRGRLLGVAFLGAYTRATVEIGGGHVVAAPANAHRSPASSLEQLVEQEVCVWWSPADAVVIRQRADPRGSGLVSHRGGVTRWT